MYVNSSKLPCIYSVCNPAVYDVRQLVTQPPTTYVNSSPSHLQRTSTRHPAIYDIHPLVTEPSTMYIRSSPSHLQPTSTCHQTIYNVCLFFTQPFAVDVKMSLDHPPVDCACQFVAKSPSYLQPVSSRHPAICSICHTVCHQPSTAYVNLSSGHLLCTPIIHTSCQSPMHAVCVNWPRPPCGLRFTNIQVQLWSLCNICLAFCCKFSVLLCTHSKVS